MKFSMYTHTKNKAVKKFESLCLTKIYLVYILSATSKAGLHSEIVTQTKKKKDVGRYSGIHQSRWNLPPPAHI